MVVALEQAASAPLCTRHLADLGANVIKIERPPTGDLARGYDSVVHGESAFFVWLNQGKSSVALNLAETADIHALHTLLAKADVFVHNAGPGIVDRLGLSWAQNHQRWPRLIDCSISGYGLTGPHAARKAFDLLLQAESGLMSLTGTPEEPARVGISVVDISAGMYALSSVLAALLQRERTGEGTLIDISMLECIAEWLNGPLFHQLQTGRQPARTGLRHSMIAPYGAFRTGDGVPIMLAIQTHPQWLAFCSEVLRRPEVATDSRFRTNEQRVASATELDTLIEDVFGEMSAPEVLQRMEAAGLPSAQLGGMKQLADHPQLSARQRWIDVEVGGQLARTLTHPLNLLGLPRHSTKVPAIGESIDRDSA